MLARALASPWRLWTRWDRAARLTMAGMVGIAAIALAAPGPPPRQAATPAATHCDADGGHEAYEESDEHTCETREALPGNQAYEAGSSGIIGY